DLLAAFVAHWDYHRKAVALTHSGTPLAGAAALLAWLGCRKTSGSSRTMARLLLISSGFAALGAIASHLPESLPGLVNRVMPGRFINLGIFALPAVLAGL